MAEDKKFPSIFDIEIIGLHQLSCIMVKDILMIYLFTVSLKILD